MKDDSLSDTQQGAYNTYQLSGRVDRNMIELMSKTAFSNTKEGLHALAKEKHIKAWSLGCSCQECNKAFAAVLHKQPDPMKIMQDEMKSACDSVGKDPESQKRMYPVMSYNTIWNDAIEAAAMLAICNAITGHEIRKLKK
jgi:bacterioferritin-associated ferredoxin